MVKSTEMRTPPTRRSVVYLLGKLQSLKSPVYPSFSKHHNTGSKRMNINEETRQFATKSSNILVSNEKEKAVCFNLFYVFVVSAWLGK